jgi:hypothetical protein
MRSTAQIIRGFLACRFVLEEGSRLLPEQPRSCIGDQRKGDGMRDDRATVSASTRLAIDLVRIRFVLGDTGPYFDGDLLVTQGNL